MSYTYPYQTEDNLARILHLDDEQPFLDEVRKELEELGHQVVSVGLQSEAKRHLAEGQFDVVICDGTLLEKWDGYHYARQLYRSGQRSMILSSDAMLRGNDQVPLVKKTRLGRQEALRQTIAGIELQKETDAMMARMQTPAAGAALDRAFNATPAETAQASVDAARKNRDTQQ